MASPEYEAFAATVKAQRTDAEPTLEELRAGMDALGMMFPPPDGTIIETVVADGVPAEWVASPDAGDERVVLYLHGGGYAIGCLSMVRNFAARLSAATGARVLSVDYRQGPEDPFPAAVEDAATAYRWLVTQGHAPDTIAVAGESAGGGLTVATLLALRDAGDPLPACAVPISPWFDMEVCGDISERADADDMLRRSHLELFAKWYLSNGDRRAPLANPLYADLAGLPPLLVLVGEREILVDDVRRFDVRAKAAGIDVTTEIVPDMIHIWHLFGGIFPESAEASDRVAAYVRERTS
jgi:monoterpene epsilon-lactone hydrolase